MLALEAQFTSMAPGGAMKNYKAVDFFVDSFTTALSHDEILTEILVPAFAPGSGGAYMKLEKRVGDFAIVGVATQISLDRNGMCTKAGIGLTAVGPTALKVTEAEDYLKGKNLMDATVLSKAGDLASNKANPASDFRGPAEYKKEMVKVFTIRALKLGPEKSGWRGDVGMASKMDISVKVNGQDHRDQVEPRLLLVHFLRENLNLTGTHIGCDTSNCGACTVLLDGTAVKSCTVFAVQANGRPVTTVEGLAQGAKLHPIQEGFWEKHGLQCGFCTPGMMIASIELLNKNPNPSEEEIRRGISGNLCRCTGYVKIVEAVQYTAEKMRQQVEVPAR